MLRFLALIIMSVYFVFYAENSAALAAEEGAAATPPSSIVSGAKAEESITNYNIGNRSVDAYSRKGSIKTITNNYALDPKVSVKTCNLPDVHCRGYVQPYNATATIKCGSSGWELSEIKGSCWKTMTVCYGLNTYSETCIRVPSVRATPNDLSMTKDYSKCSGAAVNAPKNFCLHDSDGTIGISGGTSDRMFSIANKASTYFEYKALSTDDPDRLIWVGRGGLDSRKMMMPSGALNYKGFVASFVAASEPRSGLLIERGCYPLSHLSLCDPPVITTPISGACGDASRAKPATYIDLSKISSKDFCDIGSVTSKFQNDELIAWKCSGHNNGLSKTCSISKIKPPEEEKP